MVKIVTDSASDLPPQLVNEYNISIVPARILFGRRCYRDGVDLSPNQFYDLLTKSYYHPNTTQAAPLDFYRIFRHYEKLGEDVLCITLPEALSAFIQSARLAAAEIEDIKVRVYNSSAATSQQGLIVLAAAKMAQAGFSIEEIMSELDVYKPQTSLYAVASTLDYLKRGGRISSANYRIGSLLGVLPIITVIDEHVESIDRQLFGNMEKAVDKVIQYLRDKYGSEDQLDCIVLHAQNISGASMVIDKMQQHLKLDSINITRIGATIGANIGPGALGVAIAPSISYL